MSESNRTTEQTRGGSMMDRESDQNNNENVSIDDDQSTLSDEQKRAIQLVQDGKNVFITGSAGVGKSYLLQKIIKSLPSKKLYVTASTGVAACNIGGSTLHSFAGIGFADKSAEHYGSMIRRKKYNVDVLQRWLNCQVLIIDEISMIDGDLFSKIEQVARIVRQNEASFGGIQIVLVGDFLQLPPVKNQIFAFETKAWKKSIDSTIVLKKVFRQKNFGFISLLNRLRVGHITATDIEALIHCRTTLFPDDDIKPTCLYPFRATCDKLNTTSLENLPGQLKEFIAVDFSSNEDYGKMEMVSKFSKVLNLKIGAQVMLLHNIDVKRGLVNGARGVVISYDDKVEKLKRELQELAKMDNESSKLEQEVLVQKMKRLQDNDTKAYPIVRFANGVETTVTPQQHKIEYLGRLLAYRIQVPLALAWAVSIHKAQGVTLDRVVMNIAGAFTHGQCYVALSRVTSLDGLLLRDFEPSKILAHPKVLRYYNSIDPSFPHCTKETGEKEIQEFIALRKDYVKYKQSIEETSKFVSNKRWREMRSVFASLTSPRHKADQIPNPSTSTVAIDFTDEGECSSTQEKKLNETFTKIQQKHNETVTTSSTLGKAQHLMVKCKLDLQKIKVNDTNNHDCNQVTLPTSPCIDNMNLEYKKDISRRKTFKQNHFFNTICSDLLNIADRDLVNTSNNITLKRKSYEDSSQNNNVNTESKSLKRTSTGYPTLTKENEKEDQRMKELLKAKKSEIEKKRRKALENRLHSLRRASNYGHLQS